MLSSALVINSLGPSGQSYQEIGSDSEMYVHTGGELIRKSVPTVSFSISSSVFIELLLIDK